MEKTLRANKKWALAHSSSPPIYKTDPVRSRELQTTEQLCLLLDHTPATNGFQRGRVFAQRKLLSSGMTAETSG